MRLSVPFFLASWALAASAHASYGNMGRLDGLALFLAFMLTLAYAVIVDVGLLAKIFRYRAAIVVGSILAVAVSVLLLTLTASANERAGLFKLLSGGSGPVVLAVTSVVVLPFIVIAPFAQHLAMRQERPSPRWIPGWMVLQLALLPAFVILAFTDYYYWQQEYAAAQAIGRQAKAGELGALLNRADQRHERIWGTGWSYPWLQKPVTYERPAWIVGLAIGIDASAPVAANEPLSAPDRAALRTFMEGHFLGFAVPHIRAKLIWDDLEPGRFSRELAPKGVDDAGAASEEVIPVLLDRFEKYADARVCPEGRMMDADRAVLDKLVLAKGRVWNGATRAYEMRQEWDGYPRRVERLCPGKS